MISVKRMDYIYNDGYHDYNVWIIISDLEFFKNAFILDRPSHHNNKILPDDDKIINALLSDYNNGLFDKIRGYCYISDNTDKVWCELVQLERDRKLGLLV